MSSKRTVLMKRVGGGLAGVGSGGGGVMGGKCTAGRMDVDLLVTSSCKTGAKKTSKPHAAMVTE